jgi:hypothetical protein
LFDLSRGDRLRLLLLLAGRSMLADLNEENVFLKDSANSLFINKRSVSAVAPFFSSH